MAVCEVVWVLAFDKVASYEQRLANSMDLAFNTEMPTVPNSLESNF